MTRSLGALTRADVDNLSRSESLAATQLPIHDWDHAYWCLRAAFLWFGGLLPKSDLGRHIPPWWKPGDSEENWLTPPQR